MVLLKKRKSLGVSGGYEEAHVDNAGALMGELWMTQVVRTRYAKHAAHL